MSNIGTARFKFVFMSDSHNDKSHEELGKWLKTNISDLVHDEVAKLSDDVTSNDSMTEFSAYSDAIKDDDGNEHKCWIWALGEFTGNYIVEQIENILKKPIMKQQDTQPCINEFCRTFKCFCDMSYDAESTNGCIRRRIIAPNGNDVFNDEQTLDMNGQTLTTSKPDILDNPKFEDIIMQHKG